MKKYKNHFGKVPYSKVINDGQDCVISFVPSFSFNTGTHEVRKGRYGIQIVSPSGIPGRIEWFEKYRDFIRVCCNLATCQEPVDFYAVYEESTSLYFDVELLKMNENE